MVDLWRWRSTRRGARGARTRLAVNIGAFFLFAVLCYVILVDDNRDGLGGSTTPRRFIPKRANKQVQRPRAVIQHTDDGTDDSQRDKTAETIHDGTVDVDTSLVDEKEQEQDEQHEEQMDSNESDENRPTEEKPASVIADEPAAAEAVQQANNNDEFAHIPAHPAVPIEPSHPHAIVTMASGNEAGRMAVTLVQSLLDTGTDVSKVDIVVLLPRGGTHSPECVDPEFRKAHGLQGRCGEREEIPEEIISPHLISALRRQGVKLALIDPIPRTEMTKGIPGGMASFWGMALNKLVVFNMTQYRKIVWMDSDTYALKNLDHLFGPQYVTFTSAITEACCLQNGPGIPSGGLWVLEPSIKLGLKIWELMVLGQPRWKDGQPLLGPDGKQEREFWRLGDMHIVRHLFSDWPRDYTHYRLWPWIIDDRHGYPAGLRQLPMYAAMTDAEFNHSITDPRTGKLWEEGFQESLILPQDAGRPVWRALPIIYDQCVSQCKCLPWRWPAPGVFFSVHFSCLQDGISKPGHYDSEHALMTRLQTEDDCHKYWYTLWYETYKRAVGEEGVETPRWEGPPIVDTINMTVINQRPTKVYALNRRRRRR